MSYRFVDSFRAGPGWNYTGSAIPANLSSNTIFKLQAVCDRDFKSVKLPIVVATIYSVGISVLIMARHTVARIAYHIPLLRCVM
jgi:hypothetical protein